MKYFRVPALALLFCAATLSASAATVFYTDRTTFNGSAGPLVTETFEAADVLAGSFVGMASPLNSATNNGIFDTDDVLPGFQIHNNLGPSLDPHGLAVAGTGFYTGLTKMIIAYPNTDTMDFLFGPGVLSVGFDFWTATDTAGVLAAETVTFSVYDTSNVLLGTTQINSLAAGTSFFGAVSDIGIGRVNVSSAGANSGPYEAIDNLSFGSPVPEPGTWLLVSSGLALLGLRRRRKS